MNILLEEENRNDGENEQEHHPRRKVSRKNIANNDTGWNPTPNQKEWDKEKSDFENLKPRCGRPVQSSVSPGSSAASMS